MGFIGLLVLLPAAVVSSLPSFGNEVLLEANDNIFASLHSSDALVYDWNHDGRKDLLVGTLYNQAAGVFGRLMFFPNQGTNDNPVLTYFEYVESDGSPLYVYSS